MKLIWVLKDLFRFYKENEQEYQATPTGNDPAVSAFTMLTASPVLCVGQLHHGAKAAGVYLENACSELLS